MRNDFFTVNFSWSKGELCWKAGIFFNSTGNKETKIKSYAVRVGLFTLVENSICFELILESAGIEPALLEWKSKVLTVRRWLVE